MRNKRKTDLANCDFNFQNKNNLNTNKVKTISSNLKGNLQLVEQTSGITLIALVVTIVVLLILAGVSISTVLGNNGIIPRANEAKFKTDLANIQEEFNLYVMDKTGENGDFSVGSLNASANLLEYNTQPDEEKGIGNISSVLKSSTAQKYIQSKSFSIIKGDLIYASQNAKELEWAQEVGLSINPYNIDENGVLLSSETNLMLMDEVTGTLVIPEMVTAIGEGAFAEVHTLKKLIIPPTVTEIQKNAFRRNTILEEVIIQSNEEEGKGLRTIGVSAFQQCYNLKSIVIPDTVTTMGTWVFGNCNSLKNVKLSCNANIDGAAFAHCESLEEINIPEGVQKITNWGAFANCTSLRNIHIPASLGFIEITAFSGCTSIERFQISEASNHFKFEDGILLTYNGQNIICVTNSAVDGKTTFAIPEGVRAISGISSYPIKKVIIPKSVNRVQGGEFPATVSDVEISDENPNYAVYNSGICSKDGKSLYALFDKSETIKLGENIEEVYGNAFKCCTNAKTIIFSDNCKTIQASAFEMCNAPNIKLGKGIKTISDEAFHNRGAIKNIEISDENENYLAENGAIYSKDKTSIIYLVDTTIKEFEIPSTVTRIIHKAFGQKGNLKRIKIPNSVIVIESYAFNQCNELTEIYIPESVNSIEYGAFTDCRNLTTVQINKKKGSITGSPWGAIIGERAIKWLQ